VPPAVAVRGFFTWLEARGLAELGGIRTHHVSAYIEVLTRTYKAPTVKQHLAAIRMLFDWLIVGQVVGQNPAAEVRGPKHVVKKGKTPVLDGDGARQLLDSIDASKIVSLRDRALIALLIYSFIYSFPASPPLNWCRPSSAAAEFNGETDSLAEGSQPHYGEYASVMSALQFDWRIVPPFDPPRTPRLPDTA
jgi:hypothetical protein